MKSLTNHLKASGLRCFLLLLFSIPCLAQPGSKSSSATLWGNLMPGPHRTGYKTIFTHDLSRAPITDAADPEPNSGHNPGRQMQINVWYPAKAGPKARPMRYGEYVQLLAQALNFKEPDKKKGAAIFVRNASGPGGSANALEARLPDLMQMEASAIKDAPAAFLPRTISGADQLADLRQRRSRQQDAEGIGAVARGKLSAIIPRAFFPRGSGDADK